MRQGTHDDEDVMVLSKKKQEQALFKTPAAGFPSLDRVFQWFLTKFEQHTERGQPPNF